MTSVGPGTHIAEQARQASDAGWRQEADWLYRLALARGERDPAMEAAIDRMTAAAVQAHGAIEVTQVRGLTERRTDRVVSEAGEIRDFLERSLGSRLTLMDLVEIMDIASPLLPLKGLRLLQHVDADEEEETLSLNFEAIFDQGAREQRESFYTQQFLVKPGGIPEIWSGNVFLGKPARGHGVGARQMLRLAQFARLHGIASWDDHISDDGLFLWPRLLPHVAPERGGDPAALSRGALGPARHDRLCGLPRGADPREDAQRLLSEAHRARRGEAGLDTFRRERAHRRHAPGLRRGLRGRLSPRGGRGAALHEAGLAAPIRLTPPTAFGIPAIAARMIVGGFAVVR